MGIRSTIDEVKALKANIATLAKSENKTQREIASMLQTGAALANDNRAITLIAIAKRTM